MTQDNQLMQRREEAYAALEVAIEKMTAYINACNETPSVACDAVLLVGTQRYDEDGDRTGWVDIFPRHGWQPGYITAGLLAMAQARVIEPLDGP